MWSLLRKDHIFRLGIAVAALTLAPYLAAPSAEAAADYSARYSDLPLILVAILACQWGRRRQADRAARRFWDLWSTGLACWLAVELADAVAPAGRAGVPWVEVARNLGFLGLYMFAALALQVTADPSVAGRSGHESSRLESIATVLLAFGLFVYMAWIPAVLAEPVFRTAVPTVLLYLILDGYLAATLELRRRHASGTLWRRIYAALLATVVFWGASDAVEALKWAGLLTPGPADRLLDALWLPPFLGLLVAARLGHHEMRAGDSPPAVHLTEPGLRRSPLLAQAALVPALHLTLSRLGALEPETLAARESAALVLFIALGLIAWAYQRRIEAENLEKRELDAAIDRERRLNELALAVRSTTQLPEILAGVVKIAVDLVRADAACVALVSASGEPTLVHQQGLASGSLSWLARSPGIASEVLRPGHSLKIDDYPRHPLADAEIVAQGFHGFVGVPLASGGAALGVLALLIRETGRSFSDRDLASLEVAARHAAVAIRNARLVETLERELSERQRLETAGQALIRELSAKNEELERFAYAVSHDLKSPLITVRGFLGFLERDVTAGETERVRDDLVRIQEATRRMQRLVDELLELSRIGRRVNPPETLPFDEIAREAAGLVEGRLRGRGVSVEIPSSLPYVHGDRPRLVGVVQNLLDNAAKFMGDQPHPRIEVGARTGEGTEPVFFVRDNGIGIEAPFREKVFSLFEKLDPDSEGTGVGLALVRRIIEVHGGRIWIESPGRGQGTTFAFTLPFVRPDPGVSTGRGRRP